MGSIIYALSTLPLISRLETDGADQYWVADDSAAAGAPEPCLQWLFNLRSFGRDRGYSINASKTLVLVKPEAESTWALLTFPSLLIPQTCPTLAPFFGPMMGVSATWVSVWGALLLAVGFSIRNRWTGFETSMLWGTSLCLIPTPPSTFCARPSFLVAATSSAMLALSLRVLPLLMLLSTGLSLGFLDGNPPSENEPASPCHLVSMACRSLLCRRLPAGTLRLGLLPLSLS